MKRILALILSVIFLLSLVSCKKKQPDIIVETAGLTAISEYSGSPFEVVNDNVPYFSQEELTEVAYEWYSPLDGLGRCGMAVASLGKETMPEEWEERGSISEVYPSGWEQAKYDGEWLYNRCHLIGWQLSAENANERNLITGTNYLNVEGMLPFENMVADYIKETGNHVAYRVTPVYSGDNLVCSGVQMSAYSVEDKGEGIMFNVYCYNIQPGVVINYENGESRPEKSEGSSETQANYILNTNSKKFHLPSCTSAQSIKYKNKDTFKGTREELINKGYSPGGCCNP